MSMYRKSASGAFRGRVGYHFADQGAEVHFGTVDHLSSFVQPGDRRYVLQQLPEPFGLGETLFEEGPLRRCVDMRIGDEGFEVAVDGTYGVFNSWLILLVNCRLMRIFSCSSCSAAACSRSRSASRLHLNHVFRELADHVVADQTQQQGD